MIPYDALVQRIFEAHQIIVSLSGLGIVGCIALWVLFSKYSEMQAFLIDDGLSNKFTEYHLKRLRERRAKRQECPTHGTPLRIYGGKCPIKGCTEGKEEE